MVILAGKSEVTAPPSSISVIQTENQSSVSTIGGLSNLIGFSSQSLLDNNNNDKKSTKTPPKNANTKMYAEKVFRCFAPYQWFMYALCRFPLQGRVTPNGFKFQYDKKSIPAITFGITSVLLAVVSMLFAINTFGSALDFPRIQPANGTSNTGPTNPNNNTTKPNLSNSTTSTSSKAEKYKGDYRFEEEYIFRRNVVPLIILITCLCHTTVGSWQFYKMRNFAATYFTFWTEAVEIISIDVAKGVKRYMTILLISYGAFLIMFFVVCSLRFAPVASGGPALLAILTLRCFYPKIHTSENFWAARGYGGFLFFYILICSKTFMFLFVLVCRLLKNAFAVWNSRLEKVLIKDTENISGEDKVANRTEFDLLFKDHVCMLDLLEGADALFANILESYYASQVISVIFEVYYFYRSQAAAEEFKGARRLDGVIITFYLIHTLVILIVVSITAAEVGEEAMEGLEVLRRKGMMGEMNEDELYFMLSMYTSYTGHFETALSGGGYFSLDKGFLVAIVGTVFSYFIILIQFTPSLIITKSIDSRVDRYDIESLLKQVEGTREYFKGLKVGFMTMTLDPNNSSSTFSDMS